MSRSSIKRTLSFVSYAFYTKPSDSDLAADIDRLRLDVFGQQPLGEEGINKHRRVPHSSHRGPQELTAQLVNLKSDELVWFQRKDFHCIALLKECHQEQELSQWSLWLNKLANHTRKLIQSASGFEVAAFIDLALWPNCPTEQIFKSTMDEVFIKFRDFEFSSNRTSSIWVARTPDQWWIIAAPLSEKGSKLAAHYMLKLDHGTLPLALLARTALQYLTANISNEVTQFLETSESPEIWVDAVQRRAITLANYFKEAKNNFNIASALSPAPPCWNAEINAEIKTCHTDLITLANAVNNLENHGQTIAAKLLANCDHEDTQRCVDHNKGAATMHSTPKSSAVIGNRPLRILHISDLHEGAEFDGMPLNRKVKLNLDARQRGQVLGEQFTQKLGSIARKKIDLVFFTGDLADWGHPAEYEKATNRIDAILKIVNVPRSYFFAVPGNHDVQQKVNEVAWKGIRSWLARTSNNSELARWVLGVVEAPPGIESSWQEQLLKRTAEFWNWYESFKKESIRGASPIPLGYRKTLSPGTFDHVVEPIHIIGLDSAWLCGAEEIEGKIVLKDQGSILVTEEQVEAHIFDGEQRIDGFRIALVHHPLDHLADHLSVRRLLGDNGVDILLHGHQHEPLAIAAVEPGACLLILASGCLMEGDLGKNWPNGFQLMELDVPSRSGAVHFLKWSQGGRFWANGSDIYRDAPNGILSWNLKPTSRPL